MKKRLLAMLLAVVMVCSLLPVSAMAGDVDATASADSSGSSGTDTGSDSASSNDTSSDATAASGSTGNGSADSSSDGASGSDASGSSDSTSDTGSGDFSNENSTEQETSENAIMLTSTEDEEVADSGSDATYELTEGVNVITTSQSDTTFDIGEGYALMIEGTDGDGIVFKNCTFNLSGTTIKISGSQAREDSGNVTYSNGEVATKLFIGKNVTFNNCTFVASNGKKQGTQGWDACIYFFGGDIVLNSCELSASGWEGQFLGLYGSSGSVTFNDSTISTVGEVGGWSYAMYGASVLNLNRSTMTATGMLRASGGGNINAFYSGDLRTSYDAINITDSKIDFSDNQAGGFAINNVNIHVTNSEITVNNNLGNACNSGYWIVTNSTITMDGNRGGHGLSCIGIEMEDSTLEILHNGYAGLYIQSKDSSFTGSTVDIRCNGEKYLSYTAGDTWLNTHTLTITNCTSNACEGSAWLGAVGRKGSVVTSDGSSVVAYDLNSNAADNLKSSTAATLTNADIALNEEDDEHTLFLNPWMTTDYARGNAESASNNDADLFADDNVKTDGTDYIINGDTAKIGTMTTAQLSHHIYDWTESTFVSAATEENYGVVSYECVDVCDEYEENTTDHTYSFDCAGTYVYAPLVGLAFDANLPSDTDGISISVSGMPEDQTKIDYEGTGVEPDTNPKILDDSDQYSWIFTGWYTDPECTEEYDFSTTLTDNWTVVYAGWQKIDTTMGALTISKTVENGSDADNEKAFTFTVTISGSDVDENKVDKNGGGTFTVNSDGTYTVTLTSGQSISINELTDGATYTVTEVLNESDAYTTTIDSSSEDATTATTTEGVTATGTIRDGWARYVHYTNTPGTAPEDSDEKDPGEDDPGTTGDGPEIDKTAKGLDDENQATVTLTIGGTQDVENVAVLFVLDYSTSVDVRNAAAEFLGELATKENTNIKAAVIDYSSVAAATDWTTITSSTTETELQNLLASKTRSGTNYHAGLLKAQEMLESEEVAGYTTYLITISDGITYLWTDEETDTTMSVYTSMWSPSVYDEATSTKWNDNQVNTYRVINEDRFDEIVADGDEVKAAYAETAAIAVAWGTAYSSEMGYVSYNDFQNHTKLIGSEVAIYKTTAAYEELVDSVDYAYAFKLDEGNWTNFPYGEMLMDYLIDMSATGSGEITTTTASDVFSTIKDQILYQITSGTVTDVIGGDFEWVGMDTVTLTVGTEVLTGTINGNVVTFGTADENDTYPYVLTYYSSWAGTVNGVNYSNEECIILDINVPVEAARGLTLTYKLALAEDANVPTDGSEADLPTNKDAELEYKDPEGNPGEEPFPEPDVPVTGEEVAEPSLSIDKTVNGKSSVTVDSGTTVTYKLVITAGETALTNITVTDSNPKAHGSIVNTTSSDNVTYNDDGTWTIKALDAGESETITYTYKVVSRDEGFVLTNKATATATYNSEELSDYDAAKVIVPDESGNIPDDDDDTEVPSMSITKTVSGTGADEDGEFTFLITLSDDDYNGTCTYSIGTRSGIRYNLKFKNGEAEITIKAGTKVYIYGLPNNVTYTIEELDSGDYTVSYENETGKIKNGKTAAVSINNYLSATPDLNTEDHYSYIIGYPEDYETGEYTDDESRWPVKPEGNITRAEVATIFFRLLTDEARETYWCQTNPYSDVELTDWYNNAISTLTNMGIIGGYSDGTFRPDEPITRAELTKIAVSFFEYADGAFTYHGEYTDVNGSEWYADFIAAATELGLINGYPDGTFKPDSYITRAETCTIVNRTLGRAPDEDYLLPESVMVTWPDNADTSKWYYADMQEATNSHDYDWTSNDDSETVEDWTEKLAQRDWEALEKAWSTAYSAPGGEVMG